jgi:hypothetical protein
VICLAWSDQEQEKHQGHEKSQKKECPVQLQKEGIHWRYEQCNDDKKIVKKKDEQNEESYEKKCKNQDTKNKYL